MPYKHARDLKPKDIIRYAPGKIGEVEHVSHHRICLVVIHTTMDKTVALQFQSADTSVYVMEGNEESVNDAELP